ncbi:glycosyltransferase family 2 protein [Acrocarpospora catenulata]|uniref:glycosyltransferase family 2 protein n=1 Tax=Acrocarpospora catenulata TaxID=2836182 RepID=UPI001BDAB45B|nr:glycosyltransferase family 2 protein [Acrocarpospora catenulata]
MSRTLSVIVPVRDGERFIADALTSLLRNARDDFEYIVVDDGSVDHTRAVAESFQAELPGLTVLSSPTPGGPSRARNLGMAAASGTYLTFLDGDDWYAPGYLPELVAAMERTACDFVRVDHIRVHGTRREVHRAPERRRWRVLAPRDGITRGMVDYPMPWAGIYHRRLLDWGVLTFPEHLQTAEDRAWIWRLHRLASSYAVAPLAGVFHRRGVPSSLTQIGDERQLHFFDAYLGVIDDLAGEDPALVGKAVYNLCALTVYHHRLRGRLVPHVRELLDQRTRATLRALPPAVLAETLPRLGPAREALLRRFL